MFEHRFVVAAEAIVEAAIFLRRRIECDPCGEQCIGIIGGEIEIILMHRLGAADLRRFAKHLTKKTRSPPHRSIAPLPPSTPGPWPMSETLPDEKPDHPIYETDWPDHWDLPDTTPALHQ